MGEESEKQYLQLHPTMWSKKEIIKTKNIKFEKPRPYEGF